jgi:hypothetical protein
MAGCSPPPSVLLHEGFGALSTSPISGLRVNVVAPYAEAKSCGLTRTGPDASFYRPLLDDLLAAHPPANAVLDAMIWGGDCLRISGRLVEILR